MGTSQENDPREAALPLHVMPRAAQPSRILLPPFQGVLFMVEEPASERRADGESIGHLGGGLTGVLWIENAIAKVTRDRAHVLPSVA